VPAARVAFVGLGLVGGSLAKATRRAWPGVTLIGVDRPAILEVAREAQLVDEVAPLDAAGTGRRGAPGEPRAASDRPSSGSSTIAAVDN
jgi:hypothetical protein